MDRYTFLLLAREYVSEGASRECLQLFLEAPVHMAKQLTKDNATPFRRTTLRRTRVRLGSRFLSKPDKCYEASLFVNLYVKPCEADPKWNFINTYRAYRAISRMPLALNECAGIILNFNSRRYVLRRCKDTNLAYIGDSLNDGNPFTKMKRMEEPLHV